MRKNKSKNEAVKPSPAEIQARAFIDLLAKAINAGEGFWRQDIASLYMLSHALRWHYAALSEQRRFDEKGEYCNYPIKIRVKYTFDRAFDAFVKDPPVWLPPELIAGYTPTLQRIIIDRAAFDESERQEEQESEKRRLAALKGHQMRRAKGKKGGRKR